MDCNEFVSMQDFEMFSKYYWLNDEIFTKLYDVEFREFENETLILHYYE